MFGNLLAILGFAALVEDSAVNFRVQRLDAATEHFEPPCKVGHIADWDSRVAHQFRRSAGRNNFRAQSSELARELDDAALIVNADERTLDGHRRCLLVLAGEIRLKKPDR